MAKKFAIEQYGYTDSHEKAQCEVDYLYGYNQALKDSKSPEMLEMLEELIHLFEGDNLHSYQEERIEEAKQLIKEAITL